MAVFVFSYPLIYLTGLLQVDSIETKRTQRKVRNASVKKRAAPGLERAHFGATAAEF